jgi:hypothetical protein
MFFLSERAGLCGIAIPPKDAPVNFPNIVSLFCYGKGLSGNINFFTGKATRIIENVGVTPENGKKISKLY